MRKPNVGENKPAAVTAEIEYSIGNMRKEIQNEWDEIKQHDVIFLMTIRPSKTPSNLNPGKLNLLN